MAKFEDHCAETIKLFGKPYEEVHRWLDEFARKPGYGMHHRKVRHHLDGIEEAKKLFGDEGALVAKAHIVTDLKDEGGKEIERIPKDEKDYIKMGLW